MNTEVRSQMEEWSFFKRLMTIGSLFITSVFGSYLLKEWSLGRSLGFIQLDELIKVLTFGTVVMFWIPVCIAAKMGRNFQWDRFIGYAFLTVFLASEVRIRVLGNAFPSFFC